MFLSVDMPEHPNYEALAIGDLVFLIEDHLKFVEESDVPVEIVPAEKKYFNYFYRQSKKSDTPNLDKLERLARKL
jgi:hypothetical protein